jgi:hypothetical protein
MPKYPERPFIIGKSKGLFREQHLETAEPPTIPPIAYNEAYVAYVFTQQGIIDPLFGFKVKIDLDAVIKIRQIYNKISQVARENRLQPWIYKEDVEKVLRLFLGDVVGFDAYDMEGSAYWPKNIITT